MLRKLFTDHPAAIGESYVEHLRFALSVGRFLAITTGAIVLHGLVPGVLQTTTSDRVEALNDALQARRRG